MQENMDNNSYTALYEALKKAGIPVLMTVAKMSDPLTGNESTSVVVGIAPGHLTDSKLELYFTNGKLK